MMPIEDYQDRLLTCRDCGQDFTFTAGEQAFFASKGLTNPPARCPDCRTARRNGRSGGQASYAPRAPREQYDAVCANCGNPTTVPFMPREDRPVYCSDCFQEVRLARAGSHRDDSRGYGYSSGGYDSGYSRGGGRDRRGGGRRDSRW